MIMKKNIFICFLLFILILNLFPLHSNASSPNLLENTSTEIINTSMIQIQSADTFISWKLTSNASKTKAINCNKNATITISVILSSSSAKARIGVIDSDDTYHVKSITGSGSYTFKVPSSGSYKIYCKNSSSATYTASISYSVQ
jgi:hypothetical protein